MGVEDAVDEILLPNDGALADAVGKGSPKLLIELRCEVMVAKAWFVRGCISSGLG